MKATPEQIAVVEHTAEIELRDSKHAFSDGHAALGNHHQKRYEALSAVLDELKALREILSALITESDRCVYGYKGRCEFHFPLGRRCPKWLAEEMLEIKEKTNE